MDVKNTGEKTRVVVVGGAMPAFTRGGCSISASHRQSEIIVVSSETSEVYTA
jgi:hypothetical protein